MRATPLLVLTGILLLPSVGAVSDCEGAAGLRECVGASAAGDGAGAGYGVNTPVSGVYSSFSASAGVAPGGVTTCSGGATNLDFFVNLVITPSCSTTSIPPTLPTIPPPIPDVPPVVVPPVPNPCPFGRPICRIPLG